MEYKVSSAIIDLGQHLKIILSDSRGESVIIPKDSIENIGQASDIAYLNIDETQSKILRISQFIVNYETTINGDSFDTVADVYVALSGLINYPPVPSLYNAGPKAFLNNVDDNIIQLGDPVSSITVAYSVEKGIYLIDTVLLDGLDIKTTSGSDSGQKEFALVPDTNKRCWLYVKDTFGLSDLAYIDVTYKYAVYFGLSTLDADEFESFIDGNSVNLLSFDKELNDSQLIDQTFDATGGYRIYVLFPYAWGDSLEVEFNYMGFSDYVLVPVQIEDEFGVLRDYYFWGTTNLQTGSDINIRINVL